jgi:hypothetical protein
MYCNHQDPVLHKHGPKQDNLVAQYGWPLRNINISNDNGSFRGLDPGGCSTSLWSLLHLDYTRGGDDPAASIT